MKKILLLVLLFNSPNLADAGVFIPFTPSNTYHVTTTADSGMGSLRDAVSSPDRHIVFDSVGMVFTPATVIKWKENGLWVDGAGTYPTIEGEGIQVESKTTDGLNPLTNFKINNVRFRNSAANADQFTVFNGAQNGLITHCSFSGAGDGADDITVGAHDIEISYNMYMGSSGPGPILIAFGAYHVSIHHNIFYNVPKRTPSAARRPGGSAWGPMQDPMSDNRYNIVWGPSSGNHGTMSEDSNNNFVYNLYSMVSFAIYYYSNDDANSAGGSEYVSQNYWAGNASIPNCTLFNSNWAYVDVNHPGIPEDAWGTPNPATSWNHAEWLWDGNASGAVWPDKAGIVAEWQDTKNTAGPNPGADDSLEAAARAAITIPTPSIFDETWNYQADLPPSILNISL